MGTDFAPRAIGGVQTGLTADSGSVQAGATLCDQGINIVGTVGVAGDSLILPAEIGQFKSIIICNATATSADVFPNVGATINGAAADAAVAVGANTTMEFTQAGTDGLTWVAV